MATSIDHEGPLLLLSARPELVVELLGMRVPDGSRVCVGSADFTQAVPLERRADAVFTIEDGEQNVTTALVVEVQLAADSEKAFSWPLYAASLHARMRCVTMLVVVAPELAIAKWARVPIATFQPGSLFTPIVIGPDGIPRVASLEEAQRAPELAVLSALVHGDGPGGVDVAENAVLAAVRLDGERGATYTDLIYSSLGEIAHAALEARMSATNYVYKSDYVKKFIAQGGVESSRRNLVAILVERKLGPSESARARIEACADGDTLDRWVVRAAVAAAEDDVFS